MRRSRRATSLLRKIRKRAAGAAALALALVVAAGAGRPAGAAVPLTTVRVASGLTKPLFVTSPPGDTTRAFVVEQRISGVGYIRILKNDTLQTTPFFVQPGLATGDEQGLLGLAFHPDYDSNGYFYVNYTRSGDGMTIVERFTVSANPDSADTTTGVTILTQSQPQTNHNGGWIGFGPDAYLYIAFGDGGGQDDDDAGHNATVGNGQSDSTRLGKILRIDVDGGSPFAIPPTNPYFGQWSPKNEIWAKGVRNPWRSSFDRLNGDLYIADVGQNTYEEVNYQPGTAPDAGGRNYGWRKFEGYLIHGAFCPNPCDSSGLTRPIHVYTHGGTPFRCSISGGYVYRGEAIPDLRGSYFFAEYCSDQIWTMRVVDGVITEGPIDRTAELAPGGGLTIQDITSFGENAKGELYICDRGAAAGLGEVYKIVPLNGVSGVGVGPAPKSLLLGAAHPNPSENGFAFRVGLPAAAATRLRVYDASGRLVRTILDGALSSGTREMAWDARDANGTAVPTGVYFLRLDAGNETQTGKVSVVR